SPVNTAVRLVRHGTIGKSSYPASTYAPADDHRLPLGPDLAPDLFQQADRGTVRRRQGSGGVAEPAAPVRAGPPGRAVEDEAGVEAPRQFGVRPEIPPERRRAFRRAQQMERCEVRQLHALVEDERGLEAAVRQAD